MSKIIARSHLMGHAVYIVSSVDATLDDWRYEDTGEIVDSNSPRSCIKCGLPQTKDGHDPCIANIDGAVNACCGHGVTEAYVMFNNGLILRGEFDEI